MEEKENASIVWNWQHATVTNSITTEIISRTTHNRNGRGYTEITQLSAETTSFLPFTSTEFHE